MVTALLVLLGGAGVTVQTSVNARLRRAMGSPFLSSLISFAIGTVALVVATLAVDGSLALHAAVWREPAWVWLGGLFGTVFLTSNILLIARLGAVQTAIFPIVGQVLMGLVIDATGLFEARQSDPAPLRLLGGVLVLAGALGVTFARSGAARVAAGGAGAARAMAAGAGATGASGASAWLWRGLGLLAGALAAAQAAINGHLGQVAGSAWAAALVSFSVGTAVLVVVNVALRTHRSIPPFAGARRGPAWMWTGGLIGAAYVAVVAAAVPGLGTGATVVLGLLGMIAASLVVDHAGALGNPRRPVTGLQLGALAVLVVGVLLVQLIG